MVDYQPLWNTMKEKGISQYKLIKEGIDNRLLDSLRHNRNIEVQTLEHLCKICECTPNDVIRFIEEEKVGVSKEAS